jgi:MFS family permease
MKKLMEKLWIIAYFILGAAFIGGIGFSLVLWVGFFLISLIGGYILYGLLYGLFFAIGFAIVGFYIGMVVGLILGIITIIMSPNEKSYRFVMLASSTIAAFIVATFSFEKILRRISVTGDISIEFLVLLSSGMAILLGFASQYLASRHLENTRQEKRKNT